MRHFLTLLRNELWKLIISPSAYIAAFLFLLIMGFLYQALLDEFAKNPSEQDPSLLFFRLFFLPVFFMVPLLTMKTVAEERATGTIETLLTTPVTVTEVILSKFAAGYLYYLALWAFTGLFHAIFFHFAQNEAAVDPYPIIGGYAFIALSGLLYLSLGIFASSLTRSQLVAGIVSFTLVFAFIILGSAMQEQTATWFEKPQWFEDLVSHTNSMDRMREFASGIIDTRAIVLYLSCAAAFLFLSILVVEYREGAA